MEYAVRFAIALAILVPYMLAPLDRPIWLTFVVAAAAFGLGRLVVLARPVWAKAVATVAVIAGGVVFLYVSRPRDDVPRVAEALAVAAQPGKYEGKQFVMHGHVDAESLSGSRFRVAGVPVAYEGVLPDGFRAKTEVMLTGRLEGGVFKAEQVVAKCPSGYAGTKP